MDHQNYEEKYDENPQAEKIVIIERREDPNRERISNPEESEFYKKSKRIYNNNKYAVIGLIIGIIIAILFITVGFFETLLILLLAIIGFVIGAYIDRNPIVMEWLSKFERR